jgi:hypothetical protein
VSFYPRLLKALSQIIPMSRREGKSNEISHLRFPSCLRAEKSNAISPTLHPMNRRGGRLNAISRMTRSSCLPAGKLCVMRFLRFPLVALSI